MAKKLDPAFVAKFMREERNFQLLEPYVNNSTPMKGICLTCGAEGAPRWASIKGGRGACVPCGKKKSAETQSLDPEYVHEFMLNERNFELTEPYVNNSTPMKGVCLTCGEEGAPRWDNIKKGRGACWNCGGTAPLDPEDVRLFMLEERNFELTEPYVNSSTPMKGVCLTCGEEGAPRWNDVKSGGGACSNCGRSKPLDPAFVRREMIKTYNFLPIEPYVNNSTPMRGICLVCKSPGAPTWGNVNRGQGACNGKCRKTGIKYNVPAVAYLVGGYVKDAGPSLKVGIAEAQREKGRAQENARLGLDTRLATLHFPTGYKAKEFEDELKRLINAGPGNLNDTGLSFKGSEEVFEINAADQEFLRDLLGRFGITNVPIPSLWTEENYRSRFEAWSSFTLAA